MSSIGRPIRSSFQFVHMEKCDAAIKVKRSYPAVEIEFSTEYPDSSCLTIDLSVRQFDRLKEEMNRVAASKWFNARRKKLS